MHFLDIKKNKFRCGDCFLAFPSYESQLLFHHKEHHSGQTWSMCLDCLNGFNHQVSFVDQSKLRLHLNCVHGAPVTPHRNRSTKSVCRYCDVRFGNFKIFRAHMIYHHYSLITLNCYICQQDIYNCNKSTRLQCKRDLGRDIFACGACGRSFPSQVMLRNHVYEAHRWRSNRSLCCTFCQDRGIHIDFRDEMFFNAHLVSCPASNSIQVLSSVFNYVPPLAPLSSNISKSWSSGATKVFGDSIRAPVPISSNLSTAWFVQCIPVVEVSASSEVPPNYILTKSSNLEPTSKASTKNTSTLKVSEINMGSPITLDSNLTNTGIHVSESSKNPLILCNLVKPSPKLSTNVSESLPSSTVSGRVSSTSKVSEGNMESPMTSDTNLTNTIEEVSQSSKKPSISCNLVKPSPSIPKLSINVSESLPSSTVLRRVSTTSKVSEDNMTSPLTSDSNLTNTIEEVSQSSKKASILVKPSHSNSKLSTKVSESLPSSTVAFVCGECEKTTDSSNKIKSHILEVHKVMWNLVCTYCENSKSRWHFVSKSSLEKHIASQHDALIKPEPAEEPASLEVDLSLANNVLPLNERDVDSVAAQTPDLHKYLDDVVSNDEIKAECDDNDKIVTVLCFSGDGGESELVSSPTMSDNADSDEIKAEEYFIEDKDPLAFTDIETSWEPCQEMDHGVDKWQPSTKPQSKTNSPLEVETSSRSMVDVLTMDNAKEEIVINATNNDEEKDQGPPMTVHSPLEVETSSRSMVDVLTMDDAEEEIVINATNNDEERDQGSPMIVTNIEEKKSSQMLLRPRRKRIDRRRHDKVLPYGLRDLSNQRKTNSYLEVDSSDGEEESEVEKSPKRDIPKTSDTIYSKCSKDAESNNVNESEHFIKNKDALTFTALEPRQEMDHGVESGDIVLSGDGEESGFMKSSTVDNPITSDNKNADGDKMEKNKERHFQERGTQEPGQEMDHGVGSADVISSGDGEESQLVKSTRLGNPETSDVTDHCVGSADNLQPSISLQSEANSLLEAVTSSKCETNDAEVTNINKKVEENPAVTATNMEAVASAHMRLRPRPKKIVVEPKTRKKLFQDVHVQTAYCLRTRNHEPGSLKDVESLSGSDESMIDDAEKREGCVSCVRELHIKLERYIAKTSGAQF